MSVEQAHPDAELSRQQLSGLKQRLLDEHRELSAQLASLAKELDVRPDCSISDWADAASFSETRRRSAEIAIGAHERLVSVEEALERMSMGTYGVSQRTGEPIPFARLDVLPWARTRVDE